MARDSGFEESRPVVSGRAEGKPHPALEVRESGLGRHDGATHVERLHRLGDLGLKDDLENLRHRLAPFQSQLGSVVADVARDERQRIEVQACRGPGRDDVAGLADHRPEPGPAQLEVQVPHQRKEGVFIQVGGVAAKIHAVLGRQLDRSNRRGRGLHLEEGVPRRDVELTRGRVRFELDEGGDAPHHHRRAVVVRVDHQLPGKGPAQAESLELWMDRLGLGVGNGRPLRTGGAGEEHQDRGERAHGGGAPLAWHGRDWFSAFRSAARAGASR